MNDKKKLILCLGLFSLADLLFSVQEFRMGVAEEVNPILGFYYDNSEATFVFVKLFLTFCACFLLWHASKDRQTNAIVYTLSFCYILLIIYHSYGLLFLT